MKIIFQISKCSCCAVRHRGCFKIVYGEAKEDGNSLGCESSPCVDLSMEGALGRLSLMFFLGVGLPSVLQKLLFTGAKTQFSLS